MNIGIVTTWFERGAAYVSRQYMEVLQKHHKVFIYARSGESYAIGDPEWDFSNVYWSKRINSPFTVTVIDKKEFIHWIKSNKIDLVLFNEQHWWEPLIWCKELGIKTVAYIDYYTEETVPLFGIYDVLICNTKKHLQAFDWHPGAKYIPWGTDLNLYKPQPKKEDDNTIFFHSSGMNPRRKGTDLLINAIPLIRNSAFKVIIHSQIDLKKFFPDLQNTIEKLELERKLEIIVKTVNAPGLYHFGDVYVYPSRLDGIGLTVVEAIACGLEIIVPDCRPMNEFVRQDIGKTVQIEKLFSRSNGYYWPQNEVNVQDLANKMNDSIFTRKERNINIRDFAVEFLDWNKNAAILLETINNTNNYISDKNDIVKLIHKFESKGLRKFNRYFLKFPRVISFNQKISNI